MNNSLRRRAEEEARHYLDNPELLNRSLPAHLQKPTASRASRDNVIYDTDGTPITDVWDWRHSKKNLDLNEHHPDKSLDRVVYDTDGTPITEYWDWRIPNEPIRTITGAEKYKARHITEKYKPRTKEGKEILCYDTDGTPITEALDIQLADQYDVDNDEAWNDPAARRARMMPKRTRLPDESFGRGRERRMPAHEMDSDKGQFGKSREYMIPAHEMDSDEELAERVREARKHHKYVCVDTDGSLITQRMQLSEESIQELLNDPEDGSNYRRIPVERNEPAEEAVSGVRETPIAGSFRPRSFTVPNHGGRRRSHSTSGAPKSPRPRFARRARSTFDRRRQLSPSNWNNNNTNNNQKNDSCSSDSDMANRSQKNQSGLLDADRLERTYRSWLDKASDKHSSFGSASDITSHSKDNYYGLLDHDRLERIFGNLHNETPDTSHSDFLTISSENRAHLERAQLFEQQVQEQEEQPRLPPRRPNEDMRVFASWIQNVPPAINDLSYEMPSVRDLEDNVFASPSPKKAVAARVQECAYNPTPLTPTITVPAGQSPPPNFEHLWPRFYTAGQAESHPQPAPTSPVKPVQGHAEPCRGRLPRRLFESEEEDNVSRRGNNSRSPSPRKPFRHSRPQPFIHYILKKPIIISTRQMINMTPNNRKIWLNTCIYIFSAVDEAITSTEVPDLNTMFKQPKPLVFYGSQDTEKETEPSFNRLNISVKNNIIKIERITVLCDIRPNEEIKLNTSHAYSNICPASMVPVTISVLTNDSPKLREPIRPNSALSVVSNYSMIRLVNGDIQLCDDLKLTFSHQSEPESDTPLAFTPAHYHEPEHVQGHFPMSADGMAAIGERTITIKMQANIQGIEGVGLKEFFRNNPVEKYVYGHDRLYGLDQQINLDGQALQREHDDAMQRLMQLQQLQQLQQQDQNALLQQIMTYYDKNQQRLKSPVQRTKSSSSATTSSGYYVQAAPISIKSSRNGSELVLARARSPHSLNSSMLGSSLGCFSSSKGIWQPIIQCVTKDGKNVVGGLTTPSNDDGRGNNTLQSTDNMTFAPPPFHSTPKNACNAQRPSAFQFQ